MDSLEMIDRLKQRFQTYPERHPGIQWKNVETVLRKNTLDVLIRMEETGGEVDVVKQEGNLFWFFDCAKEIPVMRRSVCYDEAARAARKTNKPTSSAKRMVDAMGAQ